MSEARGRTEERGVAAGSAAQGGDAAVVTPRVWLLVGEKRGDNTQVHNLARAVGWPVVEKSVRVRAEWVEPKPPVRASIEHIDVAASDPLEGPWPDLLLCAGRRLGSVGLWIKRASGGRTRVVVVGKPRGRPRDFDLIVAAAHYVLPEAANVVRHALPLMHVDRAELAEVKKDWVGRLTLLPRPLSALLVGGPTGGLRFDVETARRLLDETREAVDRQRGSLFVVTSRRTPRAIAEFLRASKTPNEQLYLWHDPRPGEENPYRGLLALADHFVVTMDSLSMMVEVADLGRPLSLFPLERAGGGFERALERLGVFAPLSPERDAIPAGGVVARMLAALGWPIHSRDLTAAARLLVDQGHASWLGSPIPRPAPYVDDALERVAARIRSLVEDRGA